MVTAFCPGHITCFFCPSGEVCGDLLATGSLGAGIRTSLGATVEVTEIADNVVRVIMDGQDVVAPVTESVCSQLAPRRGFEIVIENELPCSQGFGMSAAGAIASAMCICSILGLPDQQAYEAAHRAEILGGGGLGDVSAISCLEHQPVRVKAGLPPRGEVVGTDVSFDYFSVAVLGPKMHTGNMLRVPEVYSAVVRAGVDAIEQYLLDPSLEQLYFLSNRFSASAGVESGSVSQAISKLRDNGFKAGMCMLGNSIFTDAPVSDLQELLEDSAEVYGCSSTADSPRIIQKE